MEHVAEKLIDNRKTIFTGLGIISLICSSHNYFFFYTTQYETNIFAFHAEKEEDK